MGILQPPSLTFKDSVNLDILQEKLTEMGIPSTFSRTIVTLYKGRQTYVRNDDNILTTPRVTWNGIPQGSPLSALLFNIYSASIHYVLNDVNLIQFADDVSLYTT